MKDEKAYKTLIENIKNVLSEGRKKVQKIANDILLKTNWEVGRYIIEYEQEGKVKAEYGKKLLIELAKDIKAHIPRGYSRTTLVYVRLLYLTYPKSQTLSDQLGWSHYVELLSISDDLERSFYEKQTEIEKWSVKELQRQKATGLFQRLALSKNKEEILRLAKEGQKTEKPSDLLKDPYIFEFLGISEKGLKKESELEQKLIDNLQVFLLELGKGFAFIGQQYRITLDNTHYYVDLVFYHRILKCFVLIDLKINKVAHQDIGQMNMYLNYFKTEENVEGDNEPIGIVLAADKNDVLVEYALGGISNKLLIAKYQLYLPDKELLTQKIREILEG